MKEAGWQNLKQRAARGDYDLVDPLDYLILEMLPDEGELVMNFYPLAVTANELIKKKFTMFSPGQMAGAIKRLQIQGLAARVRTSGTKSFGYQRTAKGKELFVKWQAEKAKQSPDKSGGKGGKS
jgi:DNA-binding PadR family transcriptional regulator